VAGVTTAAPAMVLAIARAVRHFLIASHGEKT
jgi:hypothetical protein